MTTGRIRILAMLEADSVSGSAKGVMEFIREAQVSREGVPAMDVSVLRFSRNEVTENSLTEAIDRAGVPLYTVLERRRFDLDIIPQLRKCVALHNYDILWSNSVKSHFLVRYAGLSRVAKWVAAHHGYTTTDLKMRLYNQLDRWSLPKADRVLTVCKPFARHLERIGVQIPRIRIQHMPIRRFDPPPLADIEDLRERLSAGADARLLLTVGRLSREKGHAELLMAFAAARKKKTVSPNTRLIIVGEGKERARIETLRRDLELQESVVLAGHQRDVRPYYAIADIFVLPSHSEGSPNVLLEAMAANLPVVATAVGGVPELATNRVNALLVPSRNPVALELAITELLRDAELRQYFRLATRDLLHTHTPQQYFHSLATLFCEL
jgi:glycosyltransferase involved in cell wall biosynthesis